MSQPNLEITELSSLSLPASTSPGNKDKRLALAGPNPYAEACRRAKLNGNLEEFIRQVADEFS